MPHQELNSEEEERNKAEHQENTVSFLPRVYNSLFPPSSFFLSLSEKMSSRGDNLATGLLQR